MLFDDDIVRDILRRVIVAAQNAGGFDETLALQIERQVRADWGGAEPYIACGRNDQIAERNEKIVGLWQSGQRDPRLLATRFGLSVKQIRRIVSD